MIPTHLHRPVGLLTSTALLGVGEWLAASKEWIGLIGIASGAVGAVAYATSLIFDCRHKWRVERQEAKAEAKAAQDELCLLRRKIGDCPMCKGGVLHE